MAICIQDLPVLPDNWIYGQSAFSDDVVHIEWPEHGAMSIDFKHRSMSTGWCLPDRDPLDKKIFAGKGWKSALVTEAIARLRAAWV